MDNFNFTIEDLKELEFAWSATIEMHNGCTVPIWYTALPSAQQRIKRVLSVSSDYPKFRINKDWLIK